MADISSHVVFGAACMGAGVMIGFCDTPTITASAWFFLGTGATDLLSPTYKVALIGRKRNNFSSWSQSGWDDRVYACLDQRSYWSIPYKGSHSIFSVILLILLSWWIESEAVYWFAFGHATHIILDHPTHKRSFLFYPITPLMRLIETKWPGQNWWEIRMFQTRLWKIQQWLIPICTILLHGWMDEWWNLFF